MRIRPRLHHGRLYLLAFLLCYGWLRLFGTDQAYAASTSITGIVTDDAGQPLTNISVQLYQDPAELGFWGPTSFVGMTDATGQYTLTEVTPGRYRLGLRDSNWPPVYATTYYPQAQQVTEATDLLVRAGETLTRNVQLATTSQLAGIVTDVNNQPLEGIQVSLWMRDGANPNAWVTAGLQATTASSGTYALNNVDTGRYRVSFTDTRSPHVYSTEYYTNSTLAQATELVVPGVKRFVINAQLTGTGTVTGVVTNADGAPLPGITVGIDNDIESDGWQNSLYRRGGTTDASGVYTITNVHTGRNRLCFADYTAHYADECYNDAPPDLQRATDITVTAATTVTANAQLALRGGISGTVTDAAGQPLSLYQVYLYSDPHGDNHWITGGNWAYTDASGVYTLTGLNPNLYRVSFMDPSGQLNAPEFYNDALTIDAATNIVVQPGQITPNINARLEPFSHITGTVTDSQGQPLENISVAVYSVTPDVASLPFRQPLLSTYTKADGTYNLTGLLPGQYYVGFADPYNNALHPEYYDDAGYLMTATAITVGRALTVTNINAQLQPFAAVNYPPFATNDTAYVLEGGTTKQLQMPWGPEFTVLINDRDAESAPLTVTLVTTPTHGTVTLDASGMFTYTHNGDESTRDFFTYRDYDGLFYSPPATVTVLITPVFDLPVAVGDAIKVVQGGTATKLLSGMSSLLANDSNPEGQPLTATLVTTPTHGQVAIAANGTFTYTHDGSTTKQDFFSYRAATVGGRVSAPATVTVTINNSSIEFTKTVWIAGLPMPCGSTNTLRVPVSTTVSTTVAYCYTIHNTGLVTLTQHTLVDDQLGTILTGHPYTVTPGATYTTLVTQTIAVTTTNIATWTAATARLATVEPITATAVATVTLSIATDDQDQDGLPDVLELAGDPDHDNLPNFLDPDADGDTILDRLEAGSNPLAPKDSNNDGSPDYLDPFVPFGRRFYLPLIAR